MMKRLLFFVLILFASSPIFAKVVSTVAVSPQGAVMKNGSSLDFNAACTYSDGSSDDCSAAGGVVWSVSRPSSMKVTTAGGVAITADPGSNSFQKGFVMATAGGQVDRAAIYVQHAGDTWYEYMTPDYRSLTDFDGNVLPTKAAVGSTIALGAGAVFNYNGAGGSGQPLQDACNWSSSAPGVASVDRQGHVTAVSVGTATITCGRAGNATFGASSQNGWTAPGNVFALTVVNGGTSNQTWYVRPAGGTPFVSASQTPNGQCDGKHDADYPGSGVNQPCAVGSLSYLWLDGVTYNHVAWMISGGDTVIVRQKTAGYSLGSLASNGQPNCPGDTGDCYMPTVPSGTAARHTRILGENYLSCHADASKTKLLMDYGEYIGVNLKGSQFADVACFEITDEAACAEGNFTNNCSNQTHFGTLGVAPSALASMDNLSDLFIHGLASTGIEGAVGVGVVIDHLHLRAMPSAGINMDDDSWGTGNISVAGGLALTNSLTEFTGCVEEYPVVHNYPYIECRDQNTGGYGDGLGTASTTGDWLFDHDIWRYNFQDGLDLLHSGMHSLTVTNSQSYGNDGQQYKIGSGQTVVFANNIALHDCQRILQTFGDEPSSAIVPNVTACRAAGDGILLSMSALGTDRFLNNTYVGYGATSYDLFCEDGYDSCAASQSTYENNLNVGLYKASYETQLPGLFYEEISSMPANSGWAVRDHNLFYNFRGSCPTLNTGELCVNPDLTNLPLTIGSSDAVLDDFDLSLTSGSPAKYAGVQLPTLTIASAGVTLSNVLDTDLYGTARHNPPSIGAIEVGGGTTSSAPPTQLTTTLTLSATPNPAQTTDTVTLTAAAATVSNTVPTGTVTFTVNGSSIPVSLNTAGSASTTVSSLDAGSYVVTASYSGDSNFAATSANNVTITVGTAAPTSNVSISVAQPTYGFNVIPGSVRRLFATVTNGKTNAVNWKVKSGNGVVSASSGLWVDVTAPNTGSSCSVTRSGTPSVSSASQFTVEATSGDDSTQTADVTFNVCKPTVAASIVPAYRTLYASQQADLQSMVVGAVDTGVSWAITASPQGGDGVLTDKSFRDTVFSATVAGRYTITATSTADQSAVATATMYVTGNSMPYQVTKNSTEPVDCTVDPALGGMTYDVGPSQTYHRLADVPLGSLLPGSTIRLHNEDTTGQSPTTYNEMIQVTAAGTADQPVRLCGVADKAGNLPIMDGNGAAAHPSMSKPAMGAGLIVIGTGPQFLSYPGYTSVQNLTVEGIHLRNAQPAYSFSAIGGTSVAWRSSAACVLVLAGHQINITGMEMEGCARGGFSFWNSGNWNGSSLNHLWEGNYIHANGLAGSVNDSQLELQAWGQVVQFNTVTGIVSNNRAENLRSKGILDVIRYNYWGDGAARSMELTQVQVGTPYMSFDAFLAGTGTGTFSADSVAAWQEAFHSEFVYGNTYLNGSSAKPIRFGYDTDGGEPARKGNLFWYHNTFLQTACPGCNGQPWTLFDQSMASGAYLPQVEFPTFVALNNIVWTSGLPFQWNDFDAFIGVGGGNLLTAGWGADTMKGGTGDGWNDAPNADAYQGASNLAAHLTGFDAGDILTATSAPFSTSTWLLNAAEAPTTDVPAAVCQMPTRFAYLPQIGYAVPRAASTNIGSSDTATQTSALEANPHARGISAGCQ